jgi:hypothetical protein
MALYFRHLYYRPPTIKVVILTLSVFEWGKIPVFTFLSAHAILNQPQRQKGLPFGNPFCLSTIWLLIRLSHRLIRLSYVSLERHTQR